MSFLKKLLLILSIFILALIIGTLSSEDTYYAMMKDPYYTSPKIQKINPNNINIIVPSSKYTGEIYIARDLVLYFQSKGKNVKLFDKITYADKENFDYCGRSINIFIYGYEAFYPNKSGINIVYLLFPMLSSSVYDNFDLIAAASKKYAEKLRNNGFSATYIPQNTNPLLFKHSSQNMNIDLLFIGHMRFDNDYRPSVKYAVQNNFPIHVYGKRWNKYISDKYYKGKFIPNNELYKYYSSAKIVLNDHRPDMVDNGFIANRIFDVTACQGFIVSDYMPEIEEIYGDSIPMWRNAAEFKKIISYYLAHPEERAEKAKKAHEITMKNFTIDIIGKRFEEEIKKLIKEREN